MGFDQWSEWFKQYKVHASKITATFHSIGIDNFGTNIIITPCITGTPIITTMLTNARTAWQENNLFRHKHMACNGSTANPFSGRPASDCTKTLTCYATSAEVYDVSNLADDDFAAVTGGDPANNWFWEVFINNVSMTDSAPVVGNLSIRMVFWAEMFAPKDAQYSLLMDPRETLETDEEQDPPPDTPPTGVTIPPGGTYEPPP